MARRKKSGTLEKPESIVTKTIYFYQFLKRPSMGAKIPDVSVYKMIKSLQQNFQKTGTENDDSHPYSEAHPIDGFPNAFRFNMQNKFVDFLSFDENEFFAVYGKRDSPDNAKAITPDHLEYDNFKIEYYTSIYFDAVKGIFVTIISNRVPHVSSTFKMLFNCACPDFEYEIPCISDRNVIEKLNKAKEIRKVRVKLTGKDIKILSSSKESKDLLDGQFAELTKNKYMLIEANLTLVPRLKPSAKKSFSAMKENLIKMLSRGEGIVHQPIDDSADDDDEEINDSDLSDTIIKQMTTRYIGNDLKAAVIRSTENYYALQTLIHYDGKLRPQDVFKPMKEVYTKNKTDVLFNTGK